MINEIYPHKYDNSFKRVKPMIDDYILCFKDNNILLHRSFNHLELPKFEGLVKARYLFSIDEKRYFYVAYGDLYDLDESYEFCNTTILRTLEPELDAYAAICGKHYHYFLSHAYFCGCCGEKMVPSENEMANVCPKCQNIKYPDIMPAIIVGITYEGKLLLTKYAKGSYKNYALVAGYLEIGETLEECVKREALEEVGLELYDIKYYKSQPWGFSNTIMVGFLAKARSNKITLEKKELKEAKWFSPSEIERIEHPISVGHEIINGFKDKIWE
ncbi:MAG: NAD(+) diphosphatase [Anaeroplasmataceae bacterium]